MDAWAAGPLAGRVGEMAGVAGWAGVGEVAWRVVWAGQTISGARRVSNNILQI